MDAKEMKTAAVTDKTVEEVAKRILEIYKEAFKELAK